jgi:hypothetical protein
MKSKAFFIDGTGIMITRRNMEQKTVLRSRIRIVFCYPKQ